MSASDHAAPASGPRWQRPPTGSLIAVAGSVVMLASLLLPWYVVRARPVHYDDLSTFAVLHASGMRLVCESSARPCSLSASTGVLAAGIWDWRTLIAVGSGAIALYVVIGAQAARFAAARQRDWQVLIALAASTAAVTLAAAIVSPVSGPDGAALLGLSSSSAYGTAVGLAGALAAVVGAALLWRTESAASEGPHLSLPVPQA